MALHRLDHGDIHAAAVAQGMMSYFAGRIRAFIARSTVSAWHPLLNAEFGGGVRQGDKSTPFAPEIEVPVSIVHRLRDIHPTKASP